MSLTIQRITEKRGAAFDLPTTYTLYLSDGTRTDVECAPGESDVDRIRRVANRLLDINIPTYKHAILPGHVQALAKFKRAIIYKGENSVHREQDLNGTVNELDKRESANLTFLRYHGLLVKDDNKDAGYWLLTTRGNEFLTGKRTIPKFAIVRDNQVIDHEGPEVSVKDVWADAPYWDKKEDIVVERVFREAVQPELAL